MDKGYGLRIRQERLRRGWTQEHTAEVIGVSERQYRRYENNETTMGVGHMLTLAENGFDINYMLVGVSSYDIAIIGGMNKMPNELFEETLQEILASLEADYVNESHDMFGRVMTKIMEYYYQHIKDCNIRKVEWVNFFTMLYEEQQEEMVRKIKYRNVKKN